MKKVGIIGCGAIATLIAEAVERKLVVCDELVLYDQDEKKAEKLKSSLHFLRQLWGALKKCSCLSQK